MFLTVLDTGLENKTTFVEKLITSTFLYKFFLFDFRFGRKLTLKNPQNTLFERKMRIFELRENLKSLLIYNPGTLYKLLFIGRVRIFPKWVKM